MGMRRRGTWILGIALAVVGAWVAVAFALHDRAPIEVRQAHGLTYVEYVGRKDTINDAVAYRGTIQLDSRGCIFFDMTEPAGRYYRAAFREGTDVSPDGVRTPSGRFYAFGAKVVVDRAYDPGFDTLDKRALSGCDLDLEVFGMGLS